MLTVIRDRIHEGIHNSKSESEWLLPAERARLVNLCTWWTGNREAAEDLAQEALIVAWQQQHLLRQPAARTHWLTGIARNLCRHWRRSYSREYAYRIDNRLGDDDDELMLQIPEPREKFDVEVELTRNELAHLLDLALAKLPSLTRTVLIERFIHETPQAEVAQRLGVSEGAIEARVQRGKLALRHVLTTELSEEAATHGLTPLFRQGWQETNLWCPACGERRLRGYFSLGEPRTFTLHCACGLHTCLAGIPGLFAGIHSFRAAYTRAAGWQHNIYEQGVKSGQVICPRCGAFCAFQLKPNPESLIKDVQNGLSALENYGFWVECEACKTWQRQADMAGIAANFPVVQQFWREHPRIVSLPIRSVEVDGTAALVAGFVDRTSAARIELVFQQSTLVQLAGE